jgi:hypothetical protein
MTTIDEEYETTDLALAAFLVAQGHPLTRVEGPRGGQRTFVFPASGRDLASTYFTASVPARPFANALRDLRPARCNGTGCLPPVAPVPAHRAPGRAPVGGNSRPLQGRH